MPQVEALCEAQNIKLPADMLEVAAKYGLRASALSAYISATVCSTALKVGSSDSGSLS